MKFVKPLFWQSKNFISLLLYPLSIITLTINIFKELSYKQFLIHNQYFFAAIRHQGLLIQIFFLMLNIMLFLYHSHL